MAAAERLAGGPVSIEDIRLYAVPQCRPLRAVDLNDPLSLLKEIGGKSRPETTRPLDRPATALTFSGSLLGPGEHLFVAEGVGGVTADMKKSP
jgi:hypothetical protein